MSKGIAPPSLTRGSLGANPAKIVNGELANEGEYPYAASLSIGGSHFCGGSLITPSVVLTASYCFEDIVSSFSGNLLESVQVSLGCNDVINGNCEVINVASATLHPEYNRFLSVLGGNDLCILVLERPSSQALAQIPSPTVGQDAFTDFPSFEVGWGNEDPTSGNFVGGDELREADSIVLDNDVCGVQNDILFELAFGETDTIDETMVCSTGVSKGVCQGDSGGPLLMVCDGQDQDLVIGATSFGLGCAMTGHPSIFARTYNQAGFDFIVNEVTQAGEIDDLSIVNDFADFCPDAPLELDPNVVPTAFPTINANLWTCPGSFYATQDGCDCNCGIPDPDCQFDDDNVFGCSGLQRCNADGVCETDGQLVGLLVILPLCLCCLCCACCIALPFVLCFCLAKSASGGNNNGKANVYVPPATVVAAEKYE